MMKRISGRENAQCVIWSLSMILVLLSFSVPLFSHQTKEECIEFFKSGVEQLKSFWINHMAYRQEYNCLASFSSITKGDQTIYPMGDCMKMDQPRKVQVETHLMLMTVDISGLIIASGAKKIDKMFPDSLYDFNRVQLPEESSSPATNLLDLIDQAIALIELQITQPDVEELARIAHDFVPGNRAGDELTTYQQNYRSRLVCDLVGVNYKQDVRKQSPGLEAQLQLTPGQAVKRVFAWNEQSYDFIPPMPQKLLDLLGGVESLDWRKVINQAYEGYKRKMYIICPFDEAAQKASATVFRNASNATEEAEGGTVQASEFQLGHDVPGKSSAQQ